VADIATELTAREDKGINILINTSGVTSEPQAKAESGAIDFTDADAVGKWMVRDGADAWRMAYAGNVAAHHFLTAALLPLLDKGQQATAPGHASTILNVASLAGVTKTHSQGQFAYSSSKAAMLHLTLEWAHIFMPLGIRVNCIAPGLFPSELNMERPGGEVPMSKLAGAGEKFPAGQCVFLCWEKGEVLMIDGWGRAHWSRVRYRGCCALSLFSGWVVCQRADHQPGWR